MFCRRFGYVRNLLCDARKVRRVRRRLQTVRRRLSVADVQAQSALQLAQVAAQVEKVRVELDAALADALEAQTQRDQLTGNLTELTTQLEADSAHRDAARTVSMTVIWERNTAL